jgi:hypothetical protein
MIGKRAFWTGSSFQAPNITASLSHGCKSATANDGADAVGATQINSSLHHSMATEKVTMFSFLKTVDIVCTVL